MNVVSFMTETGLYRYATPHFYTVSDFPEDAQDLRPQSLYSSPWEGGWWRLGDAMEYCLTASVSVLDVAAKYKEDLLFNRYQAARDVIAQHQNGPPYAYFIPQDQRDPVSAVEMLRRLAFNGIDIHSLTQPVTVDGITHPEGSWVILMDQANANFVRDLFAIQNYPDLRQSPDGPPDAPYDVSGWTMPYLFDVRVVEARSPITQDLREAMAPLSAEPISWAGDEDAALWDSPPGVGFDSDPAARAIVPLEGRVQGGGTLTLDAAENNTYKALNRVWAQGGQVGFVPGRTSEEGEPGSSGSWAVSGLSGNSLSSLVRDYRLQAAGGTGGSRIAQPRIGLYRPWNASSDEGWTRWIMEMYKFDFTSLYNADVLAGELIERYDVIVISDLRSSSILDGFGVGTVPPRYVGGLGEVGVRELDAFVRAGGTLVTLNGSSIFAIEELHLPVRNVVGDLGRDEFSLSGSILQILVDPSHPVMSGVPERARIMIGNSPVFTTEEGFEGKVLAKYPAEGSPLVSGFLLGEEFLSGYAAALEVEHGDGRVVLLGMRPHWRGQPFGTFKILFNAALYSDAVADLTPNNPGFWTAPAGVEVESVGEVEEGRRGAAGQPRYGGKHR